MNIFIDFTNFISDYGEGQNLHHYQYQPNGEYLEEPQTPNYGQMSFDAIDGDNSGSYNAGQQQRRIIREIIV